MSVGGRIGRDGIAAATTIGAVQVDPRRDQLDRRQLHVVTPAREPSEPTPFTISPNTGRSTRGCLSSTLATSMPNAAATAYNHPSRSSLHASTASPLAIRAMLSIGHVATARRR
jgi:hypothetical protein